MNMSWLNLPAHYNEKIYLIILLIYVKHHYLSVTGLHDIDEYIQAQLLLAVSIRRI